ncbi:MAG: AraC family transcriptional regulator ligand-binding domain-containing protein [Acidobacteriota bacterium]
MTDQNRTVRAKFSQPKGHASIASTTAAYALSRGWSMEKIHQACGLSGMALVHPSGRLPDETLPRLWLALWREWPDEAVPIHMARAAPMSSMAGLAEGMQFAESLRQALELLTENSIVLADRLQLELIEVEGTALLRGCHPADVIDGGRAAAMASALMARLVRESLGVEDAIERVNLACSPWGPMADYLEFFGVPVEFDLPANELIFRPGSLDAPISQANTELFAYVVQNFAHAAARLKRQGFPAQLDQLRQAISENASNREFSSRAAAERAFMSQRSAQRLAAAHGYSLRGLIDQVRAVYAEELLSDPRITIGRVARLLGYSDERAFRRAFKRWTGQSPSQFIDERSG